MSTDELALHVEAANAHHNAQAVRVGRDAALLRELAIQAHARRATDQRRQGSSRASAPGPATARLLQLAVQPVFRATTRILAGDKRMLFAGRNNG